MRQRCLLADNGCMVMSMVAAPECAVCGRSSAPVELVAPGQLPAGWDQWDERARESFRRYRDPARWWLLVESIAGSNGGGDPVSEERAARIGDAFAVPHSYARVCGAEFYDDSGFCGDCDAPYCYRHWHVSRSGYGTCPLDHGKSLDPHWSPEDFDS